MYLLIPLFNTVPKENEDYDNPKILVNQNTSVGNKYATSMSYSEEDNNETRDVTPHFCKQLEIRSFLVI